MIRPNNDELKSKNPNTEIGVLKFLYNVRSVGEGGPSGLQEKRTLNNSP